MARCWRPQLPGQRQGAARPAAQLRAEPRRPTDSKRGHQPPRGPAVGRVVISGNGAGPRAYEAWLLPATRRSGRRRGAQGGRGGAGRPSVTGRGGHEGGAGGALQPARAPTLYLVEAEEWRREGTGREFFQPPAPSNCQSARVPSCPLRRWGGVQSRGRGDSRGPRGT